MARRSTVLKTSLLLAALVAAGGAAAQDVEAGRWFAENNCARCHAVGPEGPSPLAAAPAFRTFPEKWDLSALEEALAEGIVTGHEAMPEFVLSPQEIQDFLAYLATLKGD